METSQEAIIGEKTEELTGTTARTILVSIGIIAWNEEQVIQATLESLLQQSLIEKAGHNGVRCEIICVANGCTDGTAPVAARTFANHYASNPGALKSRVIEVKERGKNNAWNQFVHRLSASDTDYLFLMDADILLQGNETLWNMVSALEREEEAAISTDIPCKSMAFKQNKTLMERLSLMASQMTGAAGAQLCGQLYCIRSEIARRIYLPKDLACCEDGFIKSLVCTDFLTEPVQAKRIILAADARHTFEGYTSVRDILKNQKRQMIGQTIVHVLVDGYLRTLSVEERMNLAEVLQKKERDEPSWLKKLIAEHIRKARYFWRIIPGMVTFRFKRLIKMKGIGKLLCLPAAVAGFFVSMLSCFRAYTFLKQGSIEYWPHARMPDIKATQIPVDQS